MRLSVILVFITLLSQSVLFSQRDVRDITLYLTYEDYVSGKGESIGKYNSFTVVGSTVNLKVDKGEKKVSTKGYWGFTIDTVLFRLDGPTPLMVYDIGKIVYYETAAYHLRALLDPEGRGSAGFGDYYTSYSLTLDSEIGDYPFLKKLKKADAGMTELVDCILQTDIEVGVSSEVEMMNERNCIGEKN